MKIANKTPDEFQRLQALQDYHILDSAPESDFDELVQIASVICETPISTITLIDEARQWHKAKIGIDDNESSRDIAFCAHAIHHDDVMIVSDATQDERFFDNPLVTGAPDIRFYAGMPLISPDGFKLGTLCVIDRKPRNLTEDQKFALRVLAKQVMKQMEFRKKVLQLGRLNDTHSKLLSVISHDLRSPLNNLHGLLELSEKYNLPPEEFKGQLPLLRKSLVAADDLLANLLEWAGSQFESNALHKKRLLLRDMAEQIIHNAAGLFDTKGNRVINSMDAAAEAWADANMIRTVLRNLILNANKFTTQGTITLTTEIAHTTLTVCVADTGTGMDGDQVTSLFQWNKRASTTGTSGEKGSGFGLLVSQEFIEKNDGRIWVESTPGAGSKFCFTLSRYRS